MGNGSPLAGTTTTELELVYSPSFKETARTVFGKEICVDGTNLCFADLDGTLAIILNAFPTISSVEDLEDQLSAALSGAVGVAVATSDVTAGISAATPAELAALVAAIFGPNSDIATNDATGQATANLTQLGTAGFTNL